MLLHMLIRACLYGFTFLWNILCIQSAFHCPPSLWEIWNDRCYLQVTTSMSWFAARTICQQNGGDLVVVSSGSENDLIATRLQDSGVNDSVYVGLHNNPDFSKYRWVGTGEFSSYYIEWANGHLDTTSEKCVILNLNHREFYETDCYLDQYALCETAPYAQRCMTSDWMPWNRKCYISLPDPSTTSFNESRKLCIEKGADIVVIDTEEEHLIVNALATPYLAECGFRSTWIGLVRDYSTQPATNFIWVNGKHPALDLWYSGEPNGANINEDCTCTELIGWYDVKCSRKNTFPICEKAAARILFKKNDGCSTEVVIMSVWTRSRARCAHACWQTTGCTSFNCIKHAKLHFECQLVEAKNNVGLYKHEDDKICATYNMF
ncbi:macrophage mannose receptor 1-like [Anneissia japonica]|uniref:macrophage mannose receptor 1-like n=1 Tax=Anneissia japonica TaxID=1529436 RepID=UPI001425705D|nr:macrophage mannose receptor 1-like [Anneissia japonica]